MAEREKTKIEARAIIGKEDQEMGIYDILWLGQCSYLSVTKDKYKVVLFLSMIIESSCLMVIFC